MLPLRDNIPTAKPPVVTIALIAANVIAYFFWQRGGITLGDPSNPHYICNLQDHAAIPYEVTHPGQQCIPVSQTAFECAKSYGPRYDLPPTYLTVFTAMFMHGGLLHLGGNMLFLWIFGNNVEDAMGRVKFVIFYLLGGIAAVALQIVVSPNAQVPTLGTVALLSTATWSAIAATPPRR